MDELASTIRQRLDALAGDYAKRLRTGGDGYAQLSRKDRLDAARNILTLVADCLDSGDANGYAPSFLALAGQRECLDAPASMRALAALEDTLMPLVTTVEAATFLWRAMSQARTLLAEEAAGALAAPGSTGEAAPPAPPSAGFAEERNLLRTVIDNIPLRVYVKDTESRFVLANAATLQAMHVARPEDLIGKTDFDFFPEETAAGFFAYEQSIMRTGQPVIGAEDIEPASDPSGAPHITLSTKVPLYDAEGNIAGIVGIGQDVTEQRRAEASLASERNLLRTLIDSLPDLVYVKDTEGRFLLINEIHARRLGESDPDAVVGKSDFDYYPREMAEAFFADDQQVIRSGAPITREEPGRDADGTHTWMLTTKAPLRDASGNVIGLVGIGRDLTERKRAEADLEDRLAEINALYRAMSREGWASFRRAAGLTAGYLYDRVDVREVGDLWEPEIGLAAQRETLITSNADQAKVVAPLAVRGGEIIGALGVYDDPQAPLAPEDVALIQSVSEQVALALDAARLFDQTQATLQETDVLYKASQALGAAEDEKAVLEAVARYPLGMRAATATLWYMHTSERGAPEALELATFCGSDGAPPPDLDIGSQVAVDEMPASDLWLENPDRPLFIEDTATDPRLREELRAAMAQMGARAVVMLPLRPGRRWVGMIGFSWAEPQAFTERDARIYQALLDQAAVTLDSRRLLAESTERAEEMRFLFNVTQTATSSTADLESSLHGVAGVLREFLDDAHADVFIPDDAEDALRLAACSHLSHKSGALYPRGAASSICWAAEALEPVIIEDAAGDAGQRFDDIAPDTRAAIAIPIAAGGQLSGVIRLQSTRANAFDAHTVQLLLTLGGALHAIIQNQRLLQEVTAANERLLELDKLKSMFLANMSHELRTPLNSIIGFSRVMLKGIDGPLTELQQQDLETIHSSGQHLLGLINDILDQSKIEAGKMELSSEYFDIGEVIKGVMSTAVALVKEKPIELIQQLPADLPPVWGDEFRTRQVLLNLVSNAAKFTEEGSITVAVDQMTAENGVEALRIAVKDTGIGIDPKDMSKLFAAFQQVDASMTRRVGGTGLGLQIAKSLIEMQGGEIWVESEVGVGSVFAFSIPLHPPPAQEEEAEEAATATEPAPSLALDGAPEAPAEPLAPEAPAPPPRKVLVLDDEAGVINLYRRYLIDRGYAIVGTTDPDALEAMIAEHAPDIILLDVMMPNRDGWEVLRSLKRNPETRDIPVVVCTIVDEPERGLEMGAAEYLVKPFVEEDLVDAVRRIEAKLSDQEKTVTETPE